MNDPSWGGRAEIETGYGGSWARRGCVLGPGRCQSRRGRAGGCDDCRASTGALSDVLWLVERLGARGFLSGPSTVSVFDIDTFVWKRDLALNGSLTLAYYGLQALHRWGANGFVAADDDTIIFVQDALP